MAKQSEPTGRSNFANLACAMFLLPRSMARGAGAKMRPVGLFLHVVVVPRRVMSSATLLRSRAVRSNAHSCAESPRFASTAYSADLGRFVLECVSHAPCSGVPAPSATICATHVVRPMGAKDAVNVCLEFCGADAHPVRYRDCSVAQSMDKTCMPMEGGKGVNEMLGSRTISVGLAAERRSRSCPDINV